MPAVEAIVSDLFHTLVDPEDFRPRDFHRVPLAAEACGFDPTGFSAFWQKTAHERDVTPAASEVWIRRYAEQLGSTPSPEAVTAADEILGRYQEAAILNPRTEVIAGLGRLKRIGFRLGLLSNAQLGEVTAWSRSPLAPHFDVACFSCHIGFAKPDSRAYAHVLDRLGVPAERAVFVGDGLNDELSGAKRAGFARVVMMSGFMARNGIRTPGEIEQLRTQCDDSVNSLNQLMLLLPSGGE